MVGAVLHVPTRDWAGGGRIGLPLVDLLICGGSVATSLLHNSQITRRGFRCQGDLASRCILIAACRRAFFMSWWQLTALDHGMLAPAPLKN